MLDSPGPDLSLTNHTALQRRNALASIFYESAGANAARILFLLDNASFRVDDRSSFSAVAKIHSFMSVTPNNTLDGFKKVAAFSASLGAAVMYGFLYSIRSVNPHFEVRLGVVGAIAFVAGAIITAIFFRIVFSDAAPDADERMVSRKKMQWIFGYVIICTLGMMGSIILALRNVASARLINVIVGATIALCVISTGGFILSRAIRYFEEDSERAIQEEAEQENFD